MEELGVPVVGIGDEIPDFLLESSFGDLKVHQFVKDPAPFKATDKPFTLILTFPSLNSPVVLSELTWLGRPDTVREFNLRRLKVTYLPFSQIQ